MTWEAAAGIAHLELVISPMPDPPRDLRLERESAGAALAWSPSADPRVHAYRVYVKDDEFGPFSLRGEVPAPQTSWLVPEAVLERGGWAAVTALTDQREGFRSEVLRIPPLAAAEPAPLSRREGARTGGAPPRLTATCLPYRRDHVVRVAAQLAPQAVVFAPGEPPPQALQLDGGRVVSPAHPYLESFRRAGRTAPGEP